MPIVFSIRSFRVCLFAEFDWMNEFRIVCYDHHHIIIVVYLLLNTAFIHQIELHQCLHTLWIPHTRLLSLRLKIFRPNLKCLRKGCVNSLTIVR